MVADTTADAAATAGSADGSAPRLHVEGLASLECLLNSVFNDPSILIVIDV
jgi:hypothetical protein